MSTNNSERNVNIRNVAIKNWWRMKLWVCLSPSPPHSSWYHSNLFFSSLFVVRECLEDSNKLTNTITFLMNSWRWVVYKHSHTHRMCQSSSVNELNQISVDFFQRHTQSHNLVDSRFFWIDWFGMGVCVCVFIIRFLGFILCKRLNRFDLANIHTKIESLSTRSKCVCVVQAQKQNKTKTSLCEATNIQSHMCRYALRICVTLVPIFFNFACVCVCLRAFSDYLLFQLIYIFVVVFVFVQCFYSARVESNRNKDRW